MIGYPLQYSWAFLVAQLVKNPQCRRPDFDPWVGKMPWRKTERIPTPVFQLAKTPTGLGDFPFQSSQVAQMANSSLVAQIVKRLSIMQETRVQSLGWEDPLEKEMAIHSRTIARKIPWTEKPGRLQSMGS